MNIRSTLLLAAVAAVGATGVANAQTYIYGGGASLPFPYVRQAADCYGVKLGAASRATANAPALLDFNYTGTPAFNCATSVVNANVAVSYVSTGSGRGILGFFSHEAAGNPTDWDGSPVPSIGVIPPLGVAAKVSFGVSETAIGQAAVNSSISVNGVSTPIVGTAGVDTYNLGGEITGTVSGTAPSQVLTRWIVRDPGNTNGGQFPNPRNTYGPMIQVPILVAPITVAFDRVYKKVADGAGNVTEFAIRFPGNRADGSGGLDMTRATMCAIFGAPLGGAPVITNWNQVPNVSKAAADPAAFDVPLQITGRFDSSGTTSGWTRHLAAVCGGAYTNSSGTLPSSLRGPQYPRGTGGVAPVGETLGRYTLAAGNEGVAEYVDFTRVPAPGETIVQGRIGYLGTDYVLPFVNTTGTNNYQLATADIENAQGRFVQGTSSAASRAFGGQEPPQSDPQGGYDPAGLGNRANPAADIVNGVWVQASDKASPLADPSGSTSAYPIIATSNALIYTCYANLGELLAIRGFFGWYFDSAVVNNSGRGILSQAGFSPAPQSFRRAIVETFFNPVGTTTGLNLRVAEGNGDGPPLAPTPQCAGIPGA